MRVEIFDYETERIFYMDLEEFEYAFNNDEINQTLCKIEFVED